MKLLPTLSILLAAVVVVTSGCTSQNFCAKRTECLKEEEDIDLEDDSTRVCAAELDAQINALRANEEDDCHALADALVALRACQANLKCDDFIENDFGGECDDQVDDVEDANEEVNGGECSAFDG